MTLQFCEKCGNILRVQNIKENLSYFFCDKCQNFKLIKNNNIELISSENIKENIKRGEGIGNEDNEFATYPHKCQKCGYDKAQVLDLGIFYSDEDNLYLLKCGKCGWSEKVGRKTS